MITFALLSFQHNTSVSVVLTTSYVTQLFVFSLPILLSRFLSLIILSRFQPDSSPGPLLLAGYEDGSLLLWDVNQRSRLSQTKAHDEPVTCFTWDSQRLRGISGSCEKKLSSWMVDRQNNLQVSGGRAQFGGVTLTVLKLISSKLIWNNPKNPAVTNTVQTKFPEDSVTGCQLKCQCLG